MLHSASVVSDGEACLLVGHSGAGKSTCSRFALESDYEVISDDINVILRADDGSWHIVSVPFSGSLDDAPIRFSGPARVRLKSIYDLNQAGHTRSRKVSRASAVARLYAHLPFINLDEFRADSIMASLEGLVGAIPFRKLEFRKDPGFLELLRDAA